MEEINIKKLLVIFLMVVANVATNAQIPPTFTPITVRTPNGRIVQETYTRTEEITADDIIFIRGELARNYPLANIMSNETTTYNCHGYAWHMTEGGETVWMGWTLNPTHDYWDDKSYIEVAANLASKVSYASDNHSAVTTETPEVFVSKWGAWPLMKHHKDYCPYNSLWIIYFVAAPNIIGTSNICTSEIYTLSNNNLNANWSITPPTNAFTITSSTSSSATVKANILGQSATLRATIGGLNIDKAIQSCPPSPSISGSNVVCVSAAYTLNNATAVGWIVTSGFSISASNATSATITTSNIAGISGTLTATLSGGGTVTKSIQSCPPSISGNANPFSFQPVSYTIPNLPVGTSVTWSISNNATIISGQNTNNVTISICDGSTATLTATLSGNINTVLTKTLYVNEGELTMKCYHDHLEATYTHPHAQCFDWDISQNFTNAGIINCGNQSISLYHVNGQTGGSINARARKGNCVTSWQSDYGYLWDWQPQLIGSFNPLRPQPLYVTLYEEVPNQATLSGSIEYYWYFNNNLFAVTSESYLFTHEWPCGDYMFKLIVRADNKEASSEEMGFWGMCRGGRSSSSWSVAYPNPASNELIIDKIEEETENNIEIQSIEKSKEQSTTKVLLYSHSTTKLVYSQDYLSSTKQIKIDTSKLPNGTYYLNIIENREKVKEQTIIINH